tara:strand:+ start:843 stop:1847 length:1005 start_codon:yes stop_codon:yes gene_type:complete
MSATVKSGKEHFSVLLNELISIISPLYSGTFIDCTFGQGGVSKKILENSNNKVIALDRDKKSIINAAKFKEKYKDRFIFKNIKFSQINEDKFVKDNIKAIIFDLGYSMNQIIDPDKGLSFESKGKLNMQLGLNEFSAHEAINYLNQKDLEKIFKYFGDEKKAKIISKNICITRKKNFLKTQDLVNIVNKVNFKKKSKIHNATKTFQSLRIFVNKEVSELIFGLINAFKILPIGGVLAVISFHSIEDRIVKSFFRIFSENKNSSRYLPINEKRKQLFKLLQRKPILPSKEEIKINKPSRSAKLRYAVKIHHEEDFNQFINIFKNLLEVENLSEKI